MRRKNIPVDSIKSIRVYMKYYFRDKQLNSVALLPINHKDYNYIMAIVPLVGGIDIRYEFFCGEEDWFTLAKTRRITRLDFYEDMERNIETTKRLIESYQ